MHGLTTEIMMRENDIKKKSWFKGLSSSDQEDVLQNVRTIIYQVTAFEKTRLINLLNETN